jgi:hypothetical protein
MSTITALFLFAVFIAAEFYRLKRRLTGSIREIRPLEGDPTGLAGARVRVETSGKGEVTAFASGCQICACRIQIGQTVSLIPGPNGYVIGFPWIPKRRGGCARRMTP